MIIATGIDIVEIERFGHWHTYSRQKLSKVFSEAEIEYCLAVPAKSAERFAVRFAAKEAFFKALCSIKPGLPLLRVCKALSIPGYEGAPQVAVDWQKLVGRQPAVKVHCSLSHSRQSAVAVVIVEQP